jgi:hypothetical protein
MLRDLWKFIVFCATDLMGNGSTSRKTREITSAPTPILRQTIRQRDQMFQCLRLVDGLLSSGEVKAAQSQVRLTLTAVGGRPSVMDRRNARKDKYDAR